MWGKERNVMQLQIEGVTKGEKKNIFCWEVFQRPKTSHVLKKEFWAHKIKNPLLQGIQHLNEKSCTTQLPLAGLASPLTLQQWWNMRHLQNFCQAAIKGQDYMLHRRPAMDPSIFKLKNSLGRRKADCCHSEAFREGSWTLSPNSIHHTPTYYPPTRGKKPRFQIELTILRWPWFYNRLN